MKTTRLKLWRTLNEYKDYLPNNLIAWLSNNIYSFIESVKIDYIENTICIKTFSEFSICYSFNTKHIIDLNKIKSNINVDDFCENFYLDENDQLIQMLDLNKEKF